MRLCWRDTSVYDTNTDKVNLSYVDFSGVADTSVRDLYIVFSSDLLGEAWHIYVFRERDHANAIPWDPSTACAKIEAWEPDPAYNQDVLLDDVPENGPDMTGLVLRVYSIETQITDAWKVAFGYTASVAAVIVDQIYKILEQYMAKTLALEGFSSGRLMKHADFWQRGGKMLIASTGQEARAPDHSFGRDIAFEIQVLSTAVGGKGTDSYEQVLRYASNVWSILGDERLALDEVVHACRMVRMTEPYFGQGENEQAFIGVNVEGVVSFANLHSDR